MKIRMFIRDGGKMEWSVLLSAHSSMYEFWSDSREMVVENLSQSWKVHMKDLGKMTLVMEQESRSTQIRICMKVDGSMIW